MLTFFKNKKKHVVSNSEILIDSEPYNKSQFGQNKYGVYILKDGESYYLGDVREFTKSKGPTPYMSYLDLNRVSKKHSSITLVKPNTEVMSIINTELNKNFLSRNLMDDTITFREKLNNDFGIIL